MDAKSQQRVWFITGTSSGFGRRLVHIALSRGDLVIATARHIDKAIGFPNTPNLRVLSLDITDEDGIKGVVAEARSIWGRIDVLVNNAGNGIPAILEEGGSKVMRRQFETNVFGTLNVTTAVLPYMRAQKSGTIVMIGSRSAWKTELKGLAMYSASKAALHAYSETLAAEVSNLGIKVLIVAPGSFRTEGIYGQPYYVDNQITDYNTIREVSKSRHESMMGLGEGDPEKGMEIVVDVVRGEGVAEGKEWPLYLVLGNDAEVDLRDKCVKVLSVLDEWQDVIRSTRYVPS